MTISAQTILVIDDDPDIRDDLRMILEDHGYNVLTAPDGKAGLETAVEKRPHLIIVDMMMPRMSGFVVVELLKQRVDWVTPVMMLTANESDQQRTFAEFLGVDAYLNKPIGIKQLIDHVERLCPLTKPAALEPPHIPLETAI
jgi:two-component system, OmpR family, response regulator MprA